jgi:hypothetical protein
MTSLSIHLRVINVLGNFWGVLAGKLADRWAEILAPSLVFWAGGILAWIYAGPGWSRLAESARRLHDLNLAAKVATILGAVLVSTISAIVVQRMTLPMLRILEGYWPSWLHPVARLGHHRARDHKTADLKAWERLYPLTRDPDCSHEQHRHFSTIEHRLRHRPKLDHELMPTRIGNILRASETRPYHRYGLSAVVIWPRLWLLLPDLARQELTTARESLDESVAAVIWALGFVAFTPLAWWAAPVGIIIAIAAVMWWVPSRAEVFADLVEAVYDLYRKTLYQQLRWPLPTTPADEYQSGVLLSHYLGRGSDKSDPKFTSV